MPFISYFEQRELDAEKRGLLKGIKAMLHLQLPEQEKALMARVEQVGDLELLTRILDSASARDVEGLNKLLP
jgi:hypothetical protein